MEPSLPYDPEAETSFETKFTEMLRNVTLHLGLEFGIISRIEAGRYHVEHVWSADGAIEVGAEFDLTDTFCELTLAASDALAFARAKDTAMAAHPCYSAFQLEAYIGAPVHFRGRPYGTLNFSSSQTRPEDFSETEKDLVRLFARWVGRTLERTAVDAELREALHQAHEYKSNLEALIQSAPDGIVVHREGRVLWVNAAVADLVEADAASLIGTHMTDFVQNPSDRDVAAERIAALAQGKRPTESQLLWVTGRKGRRSWTETIGFPARWEGEPAAFTFVRDRTAERHAQAKLLQSERMATIGALAAGVAHELKNPLAYVLANLDVLAEELEENRAALPEGLRDLVTAVHEARDGARRARKIVGDLRGFSNTIEVEPTPHEVPALVEAAIGLSAYEVRHHADVVCDFGETPSVDVEEARMTQVFLNLLVNASHAIGETGRRRGVITIKTKTGTRGDALIVVSDDGIGIPEEMLPQVFEPFITSKSAGVGSGLGLSICQRIVEGFGGSIRAANNPGGGASLTVVLPPSRRVRSSAMQLKTTGRPRNRRVLVVDDDAMVRRALNRVLGRDNAVVLCSSGEEALHLLAGDSTFDVILCDLMMPTMPGWEFSRHLQAKHPSLADRIVFVTGGSVGGTAKQFMESTVAPIVEKPFDVTDLRARIEAVAQPPHAHLGT